ncbi:MAG: biotin--[acetyl-CoA-carboxylase] ligase [Gammaproteobacteria bacterium]
MLFLTPKRSKKIDLLSKKVILDGLDSKEKEALETLILLETTESTNDKAKKLVKTLQNNTSIGVFSEEQTKGRGTKGRSWISPYAENIYFSLGWKSNLSVNDLRGITLAAASSLSKNLSQITKQDVKIKWPNDLYIENKKFGGILVETSQNNEGTILVIGIGINVKMTSESGSSIDQKWNSLNSYLNQNIDRSGIASIILKNILRLTIEFPIKGLKPYLEHFNEVSLLKGKECEVAINNELIVGKVGRVNEQGELLLLTNDKAIYLSSSEVNIKKTF